MASGAGLLFSNDYFSTPAQAMGLTCGVALCTYNGQKYLGQQLNSIVSQIQLPDSIVICDDCSSDKTWEILQAFAAASPVPVKIVRNATRQGVVKNFETAVMLLESDIIFLCDQDDIWLPGRISAIATLFESAPETLLIFTDAVLVNEYAEDMGVSLFAELQISRWEDGSLGRGKAFEVLCRRNVITGATAAFRRSLLYATLPFPDVYLHDEWLGLVASAIGKVVKLSSPTIKYRQHGKNVVGVKKFTHIQVLKRLWWSTRKPGSRQFAADRIVYRSMLTERLKLYPGTPATIIHQCQDSLAFAQFRASLPERFILRLPAVLWMVGKGKYRQFGYWWKSDVFRDLIHK
jgi:glycosyltransferase involved in cell wall biosynthesis